MKKIYLLTVLLISFDVSANGFFVPQQNVTNLGLAYAGTGSQAIDASAAYYNPAGLTRIKQKQFIAGAVVADSNTFLNVSTATTTYAGPATPSAGTDKPDARALIPSMHYAHPINDKFTFGASLVSTFGSKNSYDKAAVSRYMATESEMMTIDLAPSIGYKHNQQLSLGAGLDIYHGKVILNSAIGATAGGNVANDGFLQHKGKGQQLGMHAGFLYEADPRNRFGVKYSSRVLINFKGESSMRTTNVATVSKQDIQAKIDFPESLTVSSYHDFDEQWALMGDVQWFHWSRLKNVFLKYANGAEAIFHYHYKNSYRVALGGTYQYNDKLQLKAGTSFDSTPTSILWRATTIPDGNQTALAFGARYNISKTLILDAGLAHIFSSTVAISQGPTTVINGTPPAATNSIEAKSKSHINAVGAQLTFNMG